MRHGSPAANWLALVALAWPLNWAVAAGPDGAAPISFPKIDRHPPPLSVPYRIVTRLPGCNPDDPFSVDFRNSRLTWLDLSQSLDTLLCASFDDQTIWPSTERMPPGFDPARVMELGTSPGLGLGALHESGVTGLGIGIAIVDQPLLVDHAEYAERLRLYEESNLPDLGASATMHGCAVASIAAGTSSGVAPAAWLYYEASSLRTLEGQLTYSYYAQAVRRLLEVNAQLEQSEKIRVIAIQRGWSAGDGGLGLEDIVAACDEARQQGVFVISSSLEEMYGLRFTGLGRSPLADPEDVASWEPASWWADGFFEYANEADRLLAPAGSRTTASQAGNNERVFYAQGGLSWVIPYLAGMYALACQVDPGMTPERFWSEALATAQSTDLSHLGTTQTLGPILHPVRLIGALSAPPRVRPPRRHLGRS